MRIFRLIRRCADPKRKMMLTGFTSFAVGRTEGPQIDHFEIHLSREADILRSSQEISFRINGLSLVLLRNRGRRAL